MFYLLLVSSGISIIGSFITLINTRKEVKLQSEMLERTRENTNLYLDMKRLYSELERFFECWDKISRINIYKSSQIPGLEKKITEELQKSKKFQLSIIPKAFRTWLRNICSRIG